MIESKGERAQSFEGVKTKYLDVSSVTDNSKQLIKDINGGSNIQNSIIKLDG